MSPDFNFFTDNQHNDVFETADVDWAPIREQIIQAGEEVESDRVFLDSVSPCRHRSPDIYRFRK